MASIEAKPLTQTEPRVSRLNYENLLKETTWPDGFSDEAQGLNAYYMARVGLDLSYRTGETGTIPFDFHKNNPIPYDPGQTTELLQLAGLRYANFAEMADQLTQDGSMTPILKAMQKGIPLVHLARHDNRDDLLYISLQLHEAARRAQNPQLAQHQHLWVGMNPNVTYADIPGSPVPNANIYSGLATTYTVVPETDLPELKEHYPDLYKTAQTLNRTSLRFFLNSFKDGEQGLSLLLAPGAARSKAAKDGELEMATPSDGTKKLMSNLGKRGALFVPWGIHMYDDPEQSGRVNLQAIPGALTEVHNATDVGLLIADLETNQDLPIAAT